MKKTILTGVAAVCLTASVNAQLLITGVVDGDLSGGLPKAIELYALADIPDLSIYGVGSANNGGGTDGEEFSLSGSATAGTYIWVASESTQFTTFFGFAPTFTDFTASINGDDAVELFMNGSVIDTFGDPDTNGDGEPWDYTDGWAYRVDGTSAGAFVVSNYTYSGLGGLDGASSNATADNPFPIGTYTFTAVPEPHEYAIAIAGLLLTVGVMRRRGSRAA